MVGTLDQGCLSGGGGTCWEVDEVLGRLALTSTVLGGLRPRLDTMYAGVAAAPTYSLLSLTIMFRLILRRTPKAFRAGSNDGASRSSS